LPDRDVELARRSTDTFEADTLRVQAALLDQVKAEVALENQELQTLANALLL
jgi:hypothetical protein